MQLIKLQNILTKCNFYLNFSVFCSLSIQLQQTQNMSITKTAIEPQTTIEHTRAGGSITGGNRQRLNKSMSESHIDTSRIRQKYTRQSNIMENATSNATIEQNEHDEEAKNGCAIM